MKHGFARTMGPLMAAMLLLAMVLPAQAATTGKSGPFSYSMKGNGTLKITAFDWDGYEKNTDIVIPQMIDGFTVTEIGSLAFSQGDMDYERIELPYAQKDAENATLIIPNTVTSVGDKAFFNSSIGIVNIPASVESIGVAAFCTMKLKRVTVDSANKNYASIDGSLYCKKDRELLALGRDTSKVPEGIKSLGDFSCTILGLDGFAGDGLLNELLPCSTIQIIKNFALFDTKIRYKGKCVKTEIIKMEEKMLEFQNVEIVGDYAFAKCSNFDKFGSSLRFSNKLKKLGVGSFYNTEASCYDLSECTQLTKVPKKAFARTLRYGVLPDVYLPETIEEICDSAFENALVKRLRINDTKLKIVGNRAFYGSQDFWWWNNDPDKHMQRGKCSFLSCIESIGSEAFLEAEAIETVTIPESCVYIGDNAFDKVSVKLKVQPGSYAERWAQDNGYTYDNGIKADTSWLN